MEFGQETHTELYPSCHHWCDFVSGILLTQTTKIAPKKCKLLPKAYNYGLETAVWSPLGFDAGHIFLYCYQYDLVL